MKNIELIVEKLEFLARMGKNCDVSFVANDALRMARKLNEDSNDELIEKVNAIIETKGLWVYSRGSWDKVISCQRTPHGVAVLNVFTGEKELVKSSKFKSENCLVNFDK